MCLGGGSLAPQPITEGFASVAGATFSGACGIRRPAAALQFVSQLASDCPFPPPPPLFLGGGGIAAFLGRTTGARGMVVWGRTSGMEPFGCLLTLILILEYQMADLAFGDWPHREEPS